MHVLCGNWSIGFSVQPSESSPDDFVYNRVAWLPNACLMSSSLIFCILYCIVLYLYIYIALLAVHANQKRFQRETQRDESRLKRTKRGRLLGSPVNKVDRVEGESWFQGSGPMIAKARELSVYHWIDNTNGDTAPRFVSVSDNPKPG